MALFQWHKHFYNRCGVIDMNITSAKYIKITTPIGGEVINTIKATVDGVENICIPMDEANTHYAKILRQVAAGELTIADAD